MSDGLSFDCLRAMDAVDRARRARDKAQDQMDADEKAMDDAFNDDFTDDIVTGLVVCALTGGLLGGGVGTLLGALGCGTYAVHEIHKRDKVVDEMVKRLPEDRKRIEAANDALADALDKRREDCSRMVACGDRGGRGFRRPDGKCAGWADWAYA